jgi:predicted O-methyltransferase YrrM
MSDSKSTGPGDYNSAKTSGVSAELYEYLLKHSLRQTPEQADLYQTSMKHARRGMVSAQDQAGFTQMLLKLLNAKLVIEVGAFTGFATLSMALALPQDGKVIACDVSEEYISIAYPFWDKAGVRDRIDVRIAPASETLDKLLSTDEGLEGKVDFIFIDADKTGYPTYYEQGLKLLRKGGIIAIDNVFFHGTVLAPEDKMIPDAAAIHALNQKIHTDDRVEMCMLGIADGVTLVMKK